MNRSDSTIPVLVLNCKLTGLAIMRSLGRLGVPVYGVDFSPHSAGMLSRFCKGRFIKTLDEKNPRDYLDYVLSVGERLGERTVLIPTSDELAVFVAEHQEELGRRFLFPRNDPALIRDLISKKGMYHLAGQHRFPTPTTLFPRSVEEVREYSREVTYPVMLKGIHGNRLFLRTGKKMVIAENSKDLIENYMALEEFDSPNLMLQEYIPGGDDSIYIFNGYFDSDSECRAAFTGHKIRQYPIHVGCASLGICTWNQEVSDQTTAFMKAVGYRGILDIGYRYDARDGSYKVLDINPRIGQAFRLFLGREGEDVVRVLYRDLTGEVVTVPVPREGRRWMIEDYDIESSIDYMREGSLTPGEYLRSWKGVEETAWFDRKDPYPFLWMCGGLARKILRKIGGVLSSAVPSRATTKNAMRSVVPLAIRRRICILLNRFDRLDPDAKQWWTLELLRDFAERDPNAFHRFLWSHHLAYASSYNVEERFGRNGIPSSRKLFFADLQSHLSAIGVDPLTDVRSILEVGCSLGYQLRYLENGIFPNAALIAGMDIDRYAVDEGMRYLRGAGSKIVLECEDMGKLDSLLAGRTFDVLFSTGVLMYLEEEEAGEVVKTMMRRCGKILALAGLAHPESDNSLLARSEIRASDGSFIHNLDVMAKRAGGRVVARRWEGDRLREGHSIYFVFAVPGA